MSKAILAPNTDRTVRSPSPTDRLAPRPPMTAYRPYVIVCSNGDGCVAYDRHGGATPIFCCGQCNETWVKRAHAWASCGKIWVCRLCADTWGPQYCTEVCVSKDAWRTCTRCKPEIADRMMTREPWRCDSRAAPGTAALPAAAASAAPPPPPAPPPVKPVVAEYFLPDHGARDQGTSMSGDHALTNERGTSISGEYWRPDPTIERGSSIGSFASVSGETSLSSGDAASFYICNSVANN